MECKSYKIMIFWKCRILPQSSTGSGETFSNSLEQELISLVNGSFTSPFSALMGQMSLGKLPEVYLLVTNAYARSRYCDQASFRKLVENNGMRDSAIYPLSNQTNHKIHAPSKLSLYFVAGNLVLTTGLKTLISHRKG